MAKMSWLRCRLQALRMLRATIYIFNVRTLWLMLLSCTSVAVAKRLGLDYSLEFSFIALGITFPLTFNITQAFMRRERALVALSELKASIVALYWQHRDWPQDEGFPGSIGDDRGRWASEFANAALDFLSNLEQYLRASDGYESLSEIRLTAKRGNTVGLLLGNTQLHPDEESLTASFIRRVEHIHDSLPGSGYLRATYRALNRMQVMDETLTAKSGYSKGGEGGMSRTSQYLRYLIAQTEQLRMLKLYRTPFMLRHCCSVIVHLGALMLGPYFVHAGRCDADWSFGPSPCPAPYCMAGIYSVFCMLLCSVQDSGENFFDGHGMDDVFLELASEFNDVLGLERERAAFADGTGFAAAWPAHAVARR